MSGSVTPARRRRDEYEEDEEEEEVSVDGEASQLSGRKRARMGNADNDSDDGEEEEEQEDEGSESPARPLLPDNYRRSPKGKNAMARDRSTQKHQPGSIVKVTMTNFVTYTHAVFHLGPNLNMIIGPNGTGKSSLVCAICLGLGWETKHLGRAKDISEFVKHGCRKGKIEIELAADPRRHENNPVITTIIMREGNKVDYQINGDKSNKKRVMELARSFSIQVDNLCQFLPQDRVVEFAALSPIELLAQTQRAAAPEEMTEWHQQLKEMRKEQKIKEDDQQRLTDDLGRLENRQRMQQGDVERVRERGDLQERLTTLTRLKPFPAFTVARERHKEAKARRTEAKGQLKHLQRQMEPNLQAVNQKEVYVESVTQLVRQRQALLERADHTADDLQRKFGKAEADLEQVAADLEAGGNQIKKTKQSVPHLQRQIQEFKTALKNPPREVDLAGMNEELRNKTRQIRDLEAEVAGLAEQCDTLNRQGNQRKAIVQRAQQEKTQLQSQAGQQTTLLATYSRNRDAAKAWDWIQNNRDQFKSEVFGPPILECSVKDKSQAAAIESLIPQADLMAFTVTCKEDFVMLQNQLSGTMRLIDVNIRAAPPPSTKYDSPCSHEQLRAFGLEAWIIDLIEGPEQVLAMLCDNRNIHATAYTSQEMTSDQYTRLERSGLINSWVTKSQSYQISRRREYGAGATSTRVTGIKAARFFTDAPVDRQAERDLDARIREAEGEQGELREQIEALHQQEGTIKTQIKDLKAEKGTIEKEKGAKQSALAQFQGLQPKLDDVQRRLDAAYKQIQQHKASQQAIVAKGDKIALDKGQLVLDYAYAVDALRGLHVQCLEADIMELEAKSDLTQLAARCADERQQLEAAQTAVTQLAHDAAVLFEEGKRLQEECEALDVDNLPPDQHAIFHEIREMMPDDLETLVQSTQARLDMTGGGSANIIAEYEDRERKINRDRARLEAVQNELQGLQSSLNEIKGQWEPQLDALVAKISAAFAENFAHIQCAGEVGVDKDEDFEKWKIEIRVKFRGNEPLSVLDNHRQSGGERAVSTIFYLMALQTLARAPFRVVDEINQGMDPRNERLVHSRLVSIACASQRAGGAGGSQYLLITPKLLSGLEYHRNMKVHCIASGEYMPGDNEKLDFAALAKKALAAKAMRTT